jgi:hypothetical protein
LTFIVAREYASILVGNPDVDSVETIDLSVAGDPYADGWRSVRRSVEGRVKAGEFTRAFFTQILPDNCTLYDGLIRSTTYRGYGGKVKGPHRPVLVNTVEEVERALKFATDHGFNQFRHVFLFECSPGSGQSVMDTTRAEAIAQSVLATTHGDVLFVLSSPSPLQKALRGLADASQLTFRENAALTNYCTGFVGCSSGLTWLATSEAARPLPMLQILTRAPKQFLSFASVACDFRKFGLDWSKVIELPDPDNARVVECLLRWIEQGYGAARSDFHEPLQPSRATAEKAVRLSFSRRGYVAAWLTAWRFLTCWGVRCFAAQELLNCTREALVARGRQSAHLVLGDRIYAFLRRLHNYLGKLGR